jgi:hypothetical protein
MTTVCQESWYRNYIERRKLEDKKRSIRSQESSLQERLERTQEQEGLSPSNPAEVIAALERYSANGAPENIQIADFQMNDEVNAILATDDGFDNASLQVKLSDFFEDETPLTNIDRFVCWKLGDLDALTRIERSSYMGESIRFDFQNNEIKYGDGNSESISILELNGKVT